METGGGGSPAQDADIAGGSPGCSSGRKGEFHASQVRTHGPSVIFLNQADDYESCSPSIVLLFDIVFYVKHEESSGDEGETASAKEGYGGQAGRG